MKSRNLLTLIFAAFFAKSFAQEKDSIPVVISHIFFCVDSVTYKNLLNHDFIAKIFADSREMSSKTITDSWTGKYLNGRQSYIEVFPTNESKAQPELGDKYGDLAIVFRTRKSGIINQIDQQMRANGKTPQLKFMEYEDSGKIIRFNQNLYLSNVELQETFRPYVEEFTVEFLKLFGFNESEIHLGISEEQFRERRRGRKYDKLFDNIEKIELLLTKQEFQYLAETLKYLDFSQIGYRFINNELEITCAIDPKRSYKLKAVHIKLLRRTENINIEISKNLIFRANGTQAAFYFVTPPEKGTHKNTKPVMHKAG